MSVTKYFIKDVSRRLEIDELLQNDLKRAGYSHVELTKSPVGTRVVIYAAKPGMVIGRRGQSIKDLTKLLETKFGIENAQLSVAAIEIPEQDPKVVASQVAQALQRGVHFRRSAYWAIESHGITSPRSRDHYQRKTHNRTRQIREVQSRIPPTGRRPSPQEREGRRNGRPAKARTLRDKGPNPTAQHQFYRQAHDEDSRSRGSTTSHNRSISTSSLGPGSRNGEGGGGNSWQSYASVR